MADNATNNDTAIKAVREQLDPSGEEWDLVEHQVRSVLLFSFPIYFIKIFLGAWNIYFISLPSTLQKM